MAVGWSAARAGLTASLIWDEPEKQAGQQANARYPVPKMHKIILVHQPGCQEEHTSGTGLDLSARIGAQEGPYIHLFDTYEQVAPSMRQRPVHPA